MRTHGDTLRGHDLAYAHRLTIEHHAQRANPTIERVRSRLLDHGAVDALAALDRLSPFERYVLAQRELRASC